MSEKKCKKCGKINTNRIAADDNPLLLMSMAVRPLASYNTCENCRTKHIDNVKKYGGLIATVVVVSKVAWKIFRKTI